MQKLCGGGGGSNWLLWGMDEMEEDCVNLPSPHEANILPSILGWNFSYVFHYPYEI